MAGKSPSVRKTVKKPADKKGAAVGDSSQKVKSPRSTSKPTSEKLALENARLIEENARLAKAEQERVAELAIINSVQEGLAKQLDFQGIIDLIGDKVRAIFNADTTGVGMVDLERDWLLNVYYVDRGERIPIPDGPVQRPSLTAHMMDMDTPEPILIGTQEEQIKLGAAPRPSPGAKVDRNQSFLGVPIMTGDKLIGGINIQSYKQHAFKQDDLRLLQTLANSMSVALENARLFDETQRLFKAEQERVAELQIINSIQQGLAAELDFQAIVDLVGDKLREVLNSGDIGIRWYDSKLNIISPLYEYEHNKRIHITPATPKKGGPFETLQTTKKPLVFNTAEEQNAFGLSVAPGTDQSKSTIYIPIIVSDSVIGYIITENHEREYAYGESEIRLLTTIAASLGTALENARLFDETQRLLKETEQRAQELAIINSVQQGLASKLDMQAIFELVGDKIQSMFNAQSVLISSFDHEKQVSRLDYAFENGERLFDDELLPFSVANRYMIETRQPIIIHQNSTEESAKYGLKQIEGTAIAKSLIFVPFGTGDKVNGYFSLQNFEQENAFSESDIRLLQTLAGSMGIALESARLFDETQHLLKITEDRAAELAIINSVSEGLVRELDFQAIIDLVGEKIRKEFKVEDMYIALYDSKSNILTTPYYIEHSDRFPIEPREFRSASYAGWAISNRTTLVINENIEQRKLDIGIDSSNLIGDDEEEDLTQSVLCAPIWSSGQVIGVITLYSNESNAFPESSVSLLTTLCANLGVALQNARLFDETQRLLKITEERNAELAVINAVQQALVSNLDIKSIYQAVGRSLQRSIRCDLYHRT